MEFVPIKLKHVKELAELDKECFNVPWSEKSFEDEVNNKLATYCIAIYNEKVVGYAGFWHVADEGDITNIAVSPKYRRLKIGSRLVEYLIEVAKEKKLSLLTLEVRESNYAAISLYEHYGFQKIGKRKKYYTNPIEDAFIMTLYLGGKYE